MCPYTPPFLLQLHTQSVNDITEVPHDCRVLVLGSGMGIIPLLALKAGAVHVTIIER